MDEGQAEMFSLRIPPDLLAAMHTLAGQHERTLSAEFLRAIRDYIARCRDDAGETPAHRITPHS